MFKFYIVGVGGTGSLLARDLPKLLIGTYHKMCLIDGDRVDKSNLVRQSYQEHDIGEYKSYALAKKINTFYDIKCECINKYITADELLWDIKNSGSFVPVIVGCVDNDKTRKLLENTFNKLDAVFYLDSANSKESGNIYVVAKQGDELRGKLRSQVYELSKDIHPLDKSCQAQTAKGEVQYLITNAHMALCLLQHIHDLLKGNLKVGVSNVGRFTEVHYSC